MMIAGKALYFYNNIRKDSYNITCWCVSMKKCYNFILKASVVVKVGIKANNLKCLFGLPGLPVSFLTL